MKRRELFHIAAGATVAHAAGSGKFFTPAELALVDELTEMIIPADEKSGGARAARVAEYIDAKLAESFGPTDRDTWRNGLKLVESLAASMHGAQFLKSTPAQRTAVLERMSAHESDPKAPEELFFRELKNATIQGYYTSKIGIHDDMGYLGNTYQRGDYAGFLPE